MSADTDSGTRIGRALEHGAERLHIVPGKLMSQFPFLSLCLRIITLLGLFMAFEYFVMTFCRLPDAAYSQPVLAVELLRHIGLLPLLILALAVVLLLRYGNLALGWRDLEDGAGLRLFVVFLTLLMAWPLTTYGYNHFLAQAHYFDRVMLLVLAGLVWLRPALIYPYLLLAFTLLWQFGVPSLGGSIFAHKLQVLHVLNMFAAFVAMRALFGGRGSGDFVFMTCCLVAAAYWEPALAKIQIDWLTNIHLNLLPPAAYAHGWLSFLDSSEIANFSNWIEPFNVPLAIFVLVAEGLCLVFLWRRGLSISLLVALIAFHFGVFAFYGFFFWPWIALNVGLLVLLARDLRARRIQIYSGGHLLISVVLIGLASYWAHPPQLGWHDTRLAYTYRIDAVGEDGVRYRVSPEFFAPFEDVFTMTGFSYLSRDHAVLTGPYGVTKDRNIAQRINSAESASDVFELENEVGRRHYSAQREQVFYEFLQRFVADWRKQGNRLSWIDRIAAPRQFWEFNGRNPRQSPSDIQQLLVVEVTTFFDGIAPTVIREQELNRLYFPGKEPQARRGAQ